MRAAGRARTEPTPLSSLDVLAVLVAGAAGFGAVIVAAGLLRRGLGLSAPIPGGAISTWVQALALASGAAAAIGADVARRRSDPRSRLGLVRAGSGAWATAFLAGLAFQLPLAELSNRVEAVAPSPPATRALLEQLLTPEGLSGWLSTVVALVVVAPLAEELVFRGLLLRGLLPRVGRVGAALVSSALFAVLHGPPSAVAHAFAAGCVLAWLAIRTGSSWPGVALHAGVNAAPLALVASGWRVSGLTDAAGPSSAVPAPLYGSAAAATTLLVLATAALARRAQSRGTTATRAR